MSKYTDKNTNENVNNCNRNMDILEFEMSAKHNDTKETVIVDLDDDVFDPPTAKNNIYKKSLSNPIA